jgi:DNA-binding transcriptional LysR family regulator
MMRALVLSGAGIAVMSWLDVFRDVQEGRLAFVPLSQRQAKPLSLCLCVAPQRNYHAPLNGQWKRYERI